jgi:hypothetical protein
VRNTPRSFGLFEDGNLLDNIGIQSLGHIYFEIWRKFECKSGKSNWLCKTELPRTTSRGGMPRQPRRTQPTRARRGAGKPRGPRPAPLPLYTEG